MANALRSRVGMSWLCCLCTTLLIWNAVCLSDVPQMGEHIELVFNGSLLDPKDDIEWYFSNMGFAVYEGHTFMTVRRWSATKQYNVWRSNTFLCRIHVGNWSYSDCNEIEAPLDLCIWFEEYDATGVEDARLFSWPGKGLYTVFGSRPPRRGRYPICGKHWFIQYLAFLMSGTDATGRKDGPVSQGAIIKASGGAPNVAALSPAARDPWQFRRPVPMYLDMNDVNDAVQKDVQEHGRMLKQLWQWLSDIVAQGGGTDLGRAGMELQSFGTDLGGAGRDLQAHAMSFKEQLQALAPGIDMRNLDSGELDPSNWDLHAFPDLVGQTAHQGRSGWGSWLSRALRMQEQGGEEEESGHGQLQGSHRLSNLAPARLPLGGSHQPPFRKLLESDELFEAFAEHRKYRYRDKNWVPFVWNDTLYIASTLQPHVVVQPAPHGGLTLAHATKNTPLFDWMKTRVAGKGPRGSTPAVLITPDISKEDKPFYLGVLHYTDLGHDGYRNFFYRMEAEPPFRIVKVSGDLPLKRHQLFFGPKELIAFPCGLGVIPPENKVVVSYGSGDHRTYLLVLTWEQAMGLFQVEPYMKSGKELGAGT